MYIIDPAFFLLRRGFSLWPLLALLLSLPLQAQEAPVRPDVRLVIDVSGSMKRNDPQNLRQPAVDLLVRLVPDGGRAGVWTFGKQVNMLVPHQVVDAGWREAASRKSAEINSVGLFTNIGGALETAAHDAARGNPGYATSVILLTDGMVDIAKDPAVNTAEWRRIVDEVFPALKGAGYKVHAVALSDEADKSLMEKLALETGGTFAVAKNAEDLMKIFLQAFDQAVPQQKVPLVNNRFVVDSSVNEFTALIFRQDPAEQTRLIGPDEVVVEADKTTPDVKWLRTDIYDLITVTQPFEGEWQVIAALGPDSRVTVVSNLALRVKALPNNPFRGARETLTFVLQEDGKTIKDEKFLSLLSGEVALTHGADEAGLQPLWSAPLAKPAADSGVFTVALPQFEKLGLYDLRLTLDGKTFQRQFAHRFTVREPFTASLEQGTDEKGAAQQVLIVRSHGEFIDPQQTQIAATVVNPQRRRLVKPLAFRQFDRWEVPLLLEMPGEYQIIVQVTGVDTRKEPFEYTLTPLIVQHAEDPAFAPEPAPVEPPPAEPAAEPEPPAETAPAEAPEPEPEPEAEATEPPVKDEDSLPKWLLYVLLALGNVLILGGGYLVFRKLMADAGEEVAEAEPAPAPPPAAKAPPRPADDELMAMDTAETEDEEPPMEDLDPEEPPEVALSFEPAAADEVEDVELGADDFEEDLVEQVMGESSAESKADFAAEIRRAQGLDMDEKELDEAITTLIDELDGEPRDSGDDGLPDDLDFDDEDKV